MEIPKFDNAPETNLQPEHKEVAERKKTRILFFDAPFHSDPRLFGQALDDAGMHQEIPRGALSIATLLDKKGFDARVVSMDSFINPELQRQVAVDQFINIEATGQFQPKRQQQIAEEYFDNFLQESLYQVINSFDPQVICVSYMFSPTDPSVEKMVKHIKELFPNIILLAGGDAATHDQEAKEKLLDPEGLGVTAIGNFEGEWTTTELIEQIEKNNGDLSEVKLNEIQGLSFWQGGAVQNTGRRARGPLLEVGALNYDLVLLPEGAGISNFNHYAMFARGCKGNCVFCTSLFKYEKKISSAGLDAFRQELKKVAEFVNEREPGKPKNISILDDDILMEFENGQSVFEIIEPVLYEIRLDFPEITFDVQTRVGHLRDAETAEDDPEEKRLAKHLANSRIEKPDLVLERMLKAGVRNIFLGLESGSQQILDASQKNSRVEWANEACQKVKSVHSTETIDGRARDVNLNLIAFWIVGLPGSNPEEEAKSSEFLQNLADEGLIDEIESHVFVPLPGTPSRSEAYQKYLAKNYQVAIKLDSEDNIRRALFSAEPAFEYVDPKTGEVTYSKQQIGADYQRTIEIGQELKQKKLQKGQKPMVDLLT